jgi:hypothetical protein
MFFIDDQKDYRKEENGQGIGKETEICGKLREDDKS